MYLGPSFRDSRRNGRFLVDSHTLCPWRSDGPIHRRRLACFCCSRDDFNRAARALAQTPRHLRTNWAAAENLCLKILFRKQRGGGNPNWHQMATVPSGWSVEGVMANSAQTSWELHVLGLFETRQRRVFSISCSLSLSGHWIGDGTLRTNWWWNRLDVQKPSRILR